ncbi:cytochrome C [Aggregicoccus sp. 17bor-14]|nr:c-type cytochrome [Simulacricoccus sp. 17bor-14]MRI91382.1 cytochrome C [Aggregicoccus sp. 17bor-14]
MTYGAAVLALGLGGGLAALLSISSRPVEAPLPPIVADRSAEGVARGAAIFHASCEGCHRGADSTRASGAHLVEVPAFLGAFYSANVTSHPTAGIGRATDAQVARTIRYGVNRRDALTVMPAHAMGDADLAALLGFLRSEDPLFAPDPTLQPPSRLSFVGRLIFAVSTGGKAPALPAKGIPVPAKANTVEYGHYLAHAVLDCADCHSPGFDPAKANGPKALTGGFEFVDSASKPVFSPNLTPDGATGIGEWTLAHFSRALKDGVKPDGSAIRGPMPRFRGFDDVEIAALFTYLRSLPKQQGEHPASRPVEAPPRTLDPAQLYAQLGCQGCHAPGARNHENLVRAARTHPPERIAEWIREPQRFLPGTSMPSFGSRIDPEQALVLAQWLKQEHGSAARP